MFTLTGDAKASIGRCMAPSSTSLDRNRGVCGVRLYVEGDNHIAKCVYERVGLLPSSYQVYESDFVLPRPHSVGTKA
jgi:hypothetical protein